jgi:GxxExxY protein
MRLDQVQRSDRADRLSRDVIGAAIEVHRCLGPGLLENAYATCLGHELLLRRLDHRREVALPVSYKGVQFPCSYRADLLVEDVLLVEIKAVEELTPIHMAQVLTYLRLLHLPLALLINFNVPVLRKGIRRVVNEHRPTNDKAFASFASFASSR